MRGIRVNYSVIETNNLLKNWAMVCIKCECNAHAEYAITLIINNNNNNNN